MFFRVMGYIKKGTCLTLFVADRAAPEGKHGAEWQIEFYSANGDSQMAKTSKAWYIIFVLLGVVALVLKRHYACLYGDVVYCYGGNVSASFAVYFMVRISTLGWRYGRLVTTSIVLLVVELFEVTNGFGVMTNVYDPADFVANALGVGLALLLDTLLGSMQKVYITDAGDKK